METMGPPGSRARHLPYDNLDEPVIAQNQPFAKQQSSGCWHLYQRPAAGQRTTDGYGRLSDRVYLRQALIWIAEVRQCTTTGRVLTAKARAMPSATSSSLLIVMPSAPNARPQAAKSGLVSRVPAMNGRSG